MQYCVCVWFFVLPAADTNCTSRATHHPPLIAGITVRRVHVGIYIMV